MTCRWRGLGLTWTCLRGCWRGLMMSSGDIRWRQQQCFGAWKACAKSTSAWRRCRNPGGTWRRVRRRMTTRFSGQVHWWTKRQSGWRVYQEDGLEVRNLRWRVRDFPKLTATRGGAWLAFGWPDFWVFLGGCLGARLWDWFRQAKAWCAQIWWGETRIAWASGTGHSSEPWRLRDVVESRSSKQACVTSDGGVHVRIFFVC